MYVYYNPRTNRRAICEDINHKIEDQLLEDKENDILIVYSSFSKTIKVFKWHFHQYAGDYGDTTDNIGEVKLFWILALDKEDGEVNLPYID